MAVLRFLYRNCVNQWTVFSDYYIQTFHFETALLLYKHCSVSEHSVIQLRRHGQDYHLPRGELDKFFGEGGAVTVSGRCCCNTEQSLYLCGFLELGAVGAVIFHYYV